MWSKQAMKSFGRGRICAILLKKKKFLKQLEPLANHEEDNGKMRKVLKRQNKKHGNQREREKERGKKRQR